MQHANSLRDLHVLRGLQTLADNEMVWLGRIPTDALLEMRREGALEEIRQILNEGIEDLANANPNGFSETADQILENIQSAFKRHNENVRKLKSKKWKFAGKDIGSWLAVGTIEIAAAATGTPVFGLAAFAANQILDTPKLKEIPKSIKQLAKESDDLKKSPVGLLFEYSTK